MIGEVRSEREKTGKWILGGDLRVTQKISI